MSDDEERFTEATDELTARVAVELSKLPAMKSRLRQAKKENQELREKIDEFLRVAL